MAQQVDGIAELLLRQSVQVLFEEVHPALIGECGFGVDGGLLGIHRERAQQQ